MDTQLDTADLVASLEDKYIKIEEALVQSACFAAEARTVCAEEDPVIQQLIEERRRIPSSESSRRADISKEIKKKIRQKKDEVRSAKINDILSSFSNIRQIKVIKRT